MTNIKIIDILISDNCKILIISDIGINHNRSLYKSIFLDDKVILAGRF